MINIITQNITNKNIFTPLQNSVGSYYIAKPFTEAQKMELKKEKEKEETIKGNKLGYGIAIVALAIGFGAFGVTRLFSKKITLHLKKIFAHLNNKISKLGEENKLSKNTKRIVNKLQAIFNLATVKDILLQEGLKKTPLTSKLSERITKLFQKVSIKTSTKAYSKTLNRFDNLYADFAQANNKLSKSERAIVVRKIQNIKSNLYKICSKESRNKRLLQIDMDLEGLDTKVFAQTWKDPKGFMKKAKNGKFVAKELADDAKLKLNNTVSPIKEKISFSVYDNYYSMKKLVTTFDNFIDTADKKSQNLMDKLNIELKKYQKVLKEGESKNNLPESAGIINCLTELNAHISQSNLYNPSIKEQATKAITILTKAMSDNKQGGIQDIMNIYERHIPKEDYAKLKKTVHKALKSLDYSTNLETDKLFDKIRDIKLGSASHDALAFLLSLGVIGWGLTKADGKDQRISISLKYGIPALGTIGITTLCTIGLIASGPSLLIGIASGLIINKIGEAIDNIRKKKAYNPLISTAENKTPGIKESLKMLTEKFN